jgi:ABC-type nickel/cobalt efflux system permease component RcnA
MADKKIPGAVYIIIGSAMILMSVFIDIEKLTLFILTGSVLIVIGFIKILMKEKKGSESMHRRAEHQATHPGVHHVQHPAHHPQQAHVTHNPAHHPVHHPAAHTEPQPSQVIRCSSCGVKLHSLFRFCPNCGQKLK